MVVFGTDPKLKQPVIDRPPKEVHEHRNAPPANSSDYFNAFTSNFTISGDGKFRRKMRRPRAARAS